MIPSVPAIKHPPEAPFVKPLTFLGARSAVLSDASLLGLAFIQLFSLIYLQKFAIPIGSTPIPLLLVVQLATAVYMVVWCHAELCIGGVLTFFGFAFFCLLGQAQAPSVSWPSLIQLLALNATLLVVVRVPRPLYDRVVNLFHWMMIAPACVVFIQRFLISAGFGDLINMEVIAPKSFMLPGYYYATEFGWATGVPRPNGFVFLEPSFASAFLAMAAIVDYVCFSRLKWSVFFALACLATYGSTGIVMLGAFGVFALARKSIVLVGALAVIAIAAFTIISANAALMATLRLDELANEKSSGFGRLVSPMLWLGRLIMDGGYWFKGDGAGSVTDDVGSAWPIVKLTYEYGLAAAISYVAFILTNVKRATLLLAMLPLLLIFQLTGNYLVQPALIGLLAVLCTMFIATTKAKGAVALQSDGTVSK